MDQHGNTLLMWAAFLNHPAAIELLLRQGADPNIPCHHLQRPLHQACLQVDSLPLVALLLHYGADPNLRDLDAMSPFLMACAANAVSTVDRFLASDNLVDLTLRSHRGMGPLLLAVASEANAVAALLLSYPELVDVNEQDTSGWTRCTGVLLQTIKRCLIPY
jgi:ankyrin repeat protein